MPEYDYDVHDIDHVEATFVLHHEPDAHVIVKYTVHLKNGETREESGGEVRGLVAAEIALCILDAKREIDKPKVEAAPRRSWRDRG
jgi:hypothetical protein